MLINRVTYSSPNTFFTINNISISVKSNNFTLAFFKAGCHAYPGVEKILQHQAHLFQDKYFESSQIYQLTIIYHFEHTNHDILPKFFISKSLQTLFVCT